MTSDATRNLDAEVRAVEEGHYARVDPDGSVRVISDTYHDKWYRVTFMTHIDGRVSFECRPDGTNAYTDDHLAASAHPGVTPCKHAALAARRLEREKLIVFDGIHWTAEYKPKFDLPENPLEGLPQ